MLSTVHILTGAAISSVSSDPYTVLFGSILMHYLLDMIPHADPKFEKNRKFFVVASLDLLAGLAAAFWLLGNNLGLLSLLAIFFSILPDIVTIAGILGKVDFLQAYIKWHKNIQNQRSGWMGLISQFVVIVIMVVILMTNRT